MQPFGATLGLTLALAGALAAQQPPAGAPEQPLQAVGPRARGPLGGLMGAMGPATGMYAPNRLVDRREALGLTPEQVSRLDALAQDAKQVRDKAEADAKPHWDQLAELWKQASPDVGQIRTHAQAAMQAMEAAHLAQLTAAAQARAVLTPEQRGRVAGWGDARRMRLGRLRAGPRIRGQMRMPRRPPGR